MRRPEPRYSDLLVAYSYGHWNRKFIFTACRYCPSYIIIWTCCFPNFKLLSPDVTNDNMSIEIECKKVECSIGSKKDTPDYSSNRFVIINTKTKFFDFIISVTIYWFIVCNKCSIVRFLSFYWLYRLDDDLIEDISSKNAALLFVSGCC